MMINTTRPIDPKTIKQPFNVNHIQQVVTSWRGQPASTVPVEIKVYDHLLETIKDQMRNISDLELEVYSVFLFTKRIAKELSDIPFAQMVSGMRFELDIKEHLRRVTPLQIMEADRKDQQSELNRTNRELERISPEHYQKTDPRRSA